MTQLEKILLATLLCCTVSLSLMANYGYRPLISIVSQDTIKPIINKAPSDNQVSCASNVSSALVTWYQSSGGMMASDDSGVVSIEALSTLVEVQDAFEAEKVNGCGGTSSVEVGFYAIDSCGNTSIDTLFATFSSIDNIRPSLTSQAKTVSQHCTTNSQDSLILWLKNNGGAMAIDNCSDTVEWYDFIWNDNQGNSGSGNPNLGPYPPIGRSSCLWSVTVTFFVRDQCANRQITTATFSISDTIKPYLDTPLSAIEITCESPLPSTDINIKDNCDKNLKIVFKQTSTQGQNPMQCEYYTYQLNRQWTATDICGNSSVFTQQISVIDTIVPTFDVPADATIYCEGAIDTSFTGSPTNIFDNCAAQFIISYSDSESPDEPTCSRIITRFWQIDDGCGSSNIVPQKITIQDTVPPRIEVLPLSLEVMCVDSTILLAQFSTWLDSLAGLKSVDDCTSTSFFAAVPGSYTIDDVSTFPGIKPNGLSPTSCSENGVVSRTIVDFVAYDECQNAIVSQASFVVRDTAPPTMIGMLSDTLIFIGSDDCSTNIKLPFPIFEDQCSFSEEISSFIRLDGGEEMTASHLDSNEISLFVGSHLLEYIAYDCAENSAVTSHMITVVDTIKPSIICPENITLFTDSTSCQTLVSLPQALELTDNCGEARLFVKNAFETKAQSFLTFGSREGFEGLVANNKQLIFTGLVSNALLSDPVLLLEIIGDINEDGEYFKILGEDGTDLGNTDISLGIDSCTSTIKKEIAIPKSLYNRWAKDGTMTINLQTNLSGENVINPCQDSLILEGFNDGKSAVNARLSYELPMLSFRISGATDVELQPFPSPTFIPKASLNLGINTAVYYFSDTADNVDSCQFDIEIKDNISPQILCKDTMIMIHTSGLIPVEVSSLQLLSSTFDNCGIDTVRYDRDVIDCSSLMDTLVIGIEVVDDTGNMSSCQASVIVLPMSFTPSTEVGLCGGDTLKLFANEPSTNNPDIYTFQWTGPGDFTSTDRNPIIPQASIENSGTYNVVVTGDGGCTSSANVSVLIETLQTPSLQNMDNVYCTGDSLILSTTDYTGEVVYEWYEGVPGSGVKFMETQTPSVTIKPSLGMHQYYVQVQSVVCGSLPSNAVLIEIVEPIVASVNEVFVTSCTGVDISLGTSIVGEGLSYKWSGPNGFTSVQKDPILMDVDINDQGIYSLDISQGECSSNTAETEIILFPQPIKPKLSGDGVYCTGKLIVLNVENYIFDGSLKFSFFQNNVLFKTQKDNVLIIPGAASQFAGDWKVVVDDGICISDTSDVFKVVIENKLTIGASSNSPVCELDSVYLQVTTSANAEYHWEGPNGFESNLQNPVIEPVPGTYVVTVTSTSSCSNTAIVQVNVVQQPTITALSNSALDCENGDKDVRLVPSVFPMESYTYNWSGPNGFTSSDSIAVLADFTSADNGTYSLIISNGTCESEIATTVINATDKPNPVTINGFSLVCLGDTVRLDVDQIVVNVDSFVWTTPRGQMVTTLPFLQITNSKEADAGLYSVKVADGLCLSTASNTFMVDIVNAPSPPLATQIGSTCAGSNIQLSANLISGATYEWRGPNGYTAFDRNPQIFNIGEDKEGEYSVRVDINGCKSAWSQSIFINVMDQPIAAIALPINQSICLSQDELSFMLCVDQNTGPVGAQYRWINLANDSIIGTTSAFCLEVTDARDFKPGNQTIALYTSLNGCQSDQSSQIMLSFLDADNIKADAGDDRLACDQLSVTLQAKNDAGLSGFWSSTDPQVIIVNPTNATSTASGLTRETTSFIWNLTEPNCGVYSRDTIEVRFVQDIVVNDDQYSIQYNETIEINPLANDVYLGETLIGLLNPPEDIDIEILDGKLRLDPSVNAVGQYTITYELCSAICVEICDIGEITVDISGVDDCYVTNVITPNNDGINDFLIAPCLEGGVYPSNELVIFNEWGAELYKAAPYNNDWDGYYNGKALPVGTYFYILRLSDQEILKGFIMIEQ